MTDSATPPISAEENKNLLTKPDNLLKACSIIFGGFYVIGLIVANTHLLKLDISDFSILNPRLVMTGAMFSLYLMFLLLLVALITFWPQSVWYSFKQKNIRHPYTATILISLIGIVSAAYFIAIFIFQYSETFYAIPRQQNTGLVSLIKSNLIDFLADGKVFYCFIGFALCTMRISPSTRSIFAANLFLNIMLLALFIIAFGTFISHFADDVYPKLKYNFGGGQPQIAQIQVEASDDLKKLLGEIPGIYYADVPPAICDKNTMVGTTASVVAIWYQSDKFLYFSPSPSVNSVKVIAMDLKVIREIRYLPMYAILNADSRIDKVECVKKANSSHAATPATSK